MNNKIEDFKENYGQGWISLFRSIQNHWLFKNDKWFKWWVIMLFEVNHSGNKMPLGYEVHNIERGQSSNSLRTWGRLFNTGTKQVTRFFDMLEKDGMITRNTIGKGKQSTTLININKYDQYQGGRETQETTERTTQGKRKRHTNNNVNNENNDNNIPFDNFWKLYDKKVGSKLKAEKKWNSLSVTAKQKIMKTLPNFISNIKDKQFQPHALTYLNNDRWEDELPTAPVKRVSPTEQQVADYKAGVGALKPING